MNRLRRAVATLTVAGLAVPLWAVPAHADSTTETASSAAYFNQFGLTQPPGLEAAPAPPPLINEVDGVAPGNLAVAAQGGNEDKVSFYYFGLSDVPVGSTVSKAVLTVPLVPADNANTTFGIDDPAVISACKIIGSGFSSEEGTDLKLAPQRDCPTFSGKAAREGESLVFDVTALVLSWAEVNDGVAVTRTPGANSPFQAVLSKQATLAVEYTPPAVDDAAGSTFDLGTSTTDVGAGTTSLGGFSGGTSDLGGGSASLGSGFGAVTAPLTGAPLPAAAAPQTAGDAPVLAAPVSAPGLFSDSSPTAGFFLAALLLAGVLALLSLVLGDPRATTAGSTAPSRLTQALSARGRGAAMPALGARAL